MADLKRIKRPAGQKEHYRFFQHTASQRKWKVKVDVQEGLPALAVPEDPLTPTTYGLTISASPVDDAGKALRDAKGRPIVTDTYTHAFNEDEMALPNFDPEARMAEFIEQRVAVGEAVMRAHDKMSAFLAGWVADDEPAAVVVPDRATGRLTKAP